MTLTRAKFVEGWDQKPDQRVTEIKTAIITVISRNFNRRRPRNEVIAGG